MFERSASALELAEMILEILDKNGTIEITKVSGQVRVWLLCGPRPAVALAPKLLDAFRLAAKELQEGSL